MSTDYSDKKLTGKDNCSSCGDKMYYKESGSHVAMSTPAFAFTSDDYSYLEGEFKTFFDSTVRTKVNEICDNTQSYNIDGKDTLPEAKTELNKDIDDIISGLSTLAKTFDGLVESSNGEIADNAKVRGLNTSENGPHCDC